MEEKIREFLSSRLMIEFGDGIDADTDLFQLGLIDSHAYVELIRFIETEFTLRFSDEEILSNVTTSLAGMVEFVTAKSAAQV